MKNVFLNLMDYMGRENRENITKAFFESTLVGIIAGTTIFLFSQIPPINTHPVEFSIIIIVIGLVCYFLYKKKSGKRKKSKP